MLRMLRIVVCMGLLLSGLLSEKPVLQAQEAATMNGAKAVRFEQSPGFFNYISFCVTPKDFLERMPEGKLPPDKLEYGLCWYVDGSKGASAAVPGKLVVSEHHVRFVPDDPKSGDAYLDIPREQAAVKHQAGQAGATLAGKGETFGFRLSKLCTTCAAGTPVPQGVVPALLDQNFALLDETILHYYSGWRQIYALSSGAPAGSRNQTGTAVASAVPRSASHSAPKGSASAASTDVKAAAAPSAGASTQVAPARASAPSAATPATSTLNAAVNSMPAKTPAPVVIGAPKGKPVKIASADGMLVKKVPPDYPLEAKLVRLEGTVMLRAIIDRTGEVSEVNAVSGPPLLESAAVDAVKQWQYRPYSMNGQPVDVETTIAVVFALDGGHPVAARTRASASRQ